MSKNEADTPRPASGIGEEARAEAEALSGSERPSTPDSGSEGEVVPAADAAGPPPPEVPEAEAGAADATGYVPPDEATYRDLVEKAERSEKLRQELLRARADLDNYQKRIRRERPRWEDQAVRRLVEDILPVVDNFERALDSRMADEGTLEGLTEGVRMIYQMLRQALASHGVEPIMALYEQFDPERHEAIVQAEVPGGRTGEIIEEQLKGYLHKGVVVRPSRVVVAKGVDPEAPEAPGGEAAGPGTAEETDSDGER